MLSHYLGAKYIHKSTEYKDMGTPEGMKVQQDYKMAYVLRVIIKCRKMYFRASRWNN